jgi:RNA polymerase sigma-70 factor (ECF subfamily)
MGSAADDGFVRRTAADSMKLETSFGNCICVFSFPMSTTDSAETLKLLSAIERGERAAADRLFARHRRRLRTFIEARIDPALAKRLDASDVVQETQTVMCAKLQDFMARQPMPFRTWVIKTAFDCLSKARRTHILTSKRSVQREELALSDRSSAILVKRLASPDSSAGEAMLRAERIALVHRGLSELSDTDREILVMRYVDGLSNLEIGDILSLHTDAVSKRHGRAIRRLHKVMQEFRDDDDE